MPTAGASASVTRTGCRSGPGRNCSCNGCHDRASGQSHGRANLFAAVNAGASSTGLPFPNTNPALFADFGETMAQTRARISCQTDCAALALSLDIAYDDVWTDPVAAGRAPDAGFAYRYVDLDTPAPTSADCLASWRSGCRGTIHYEAHIHPLWSKPRVTLAADGVTVHGRRHLHDAVTPIVTQPARRACRPASWS